MTEGSEVRCFGFPGLTQMLVGVGAQHDIERHPERREGSPTNVSKPTLVCPHAREILQLTFQDDDFQNHF